ncbi:MAG TPA: TatD family hydrolase, partial [Verrucomicrobiae bacterium]
EVFLAQLHLAAERNLPVAIHCLQSWGRMLELLQKNPRPRRGLLLHSYGGPPEMIPALAKLGAYFSFPGYYLHDRKSRQRETFRHVPPERLLIETDAPDQPLPAGSSLYALTGPDGKPINHPANLPAIYAGLADFLGEPLEPFTARIGENFQRLFGDIL